MLPEWAAAFVQTVYTMVHVTGAAAAALVCPPFGAAVGGAFALNGFAIQEALRGDIAAVNGSLHKQYEMQYRMIQDKLGNLTNSLVDVNGSIIQNKEIMEDIQTMLNKTSEETHQMLNEIRKMIVGNAEENRQLLKNIQTTLKSFEANMKNNFEELKVFMIQKDFVQEIQLEMDTLWYEMEEAINTGSEKNVKLFIKAYEANNPTDLLRKFIVRLGHKDTNPIIAAMEHRVLDSRNILHHYTLWFSQSIFKLVALDGFYHGVADEPNKDPSKFIDGLTREIESITSKYRSFVADYKMESTLYWTELVEKTANEEISLHGQDITSIADTLRDRLEGIYTNDTFIVYVWLREDNFGPAQGHANHYNVASDKNRRTYIEIGEGVTPRIEVSVRRSTKLAEVTAEQKDLVRTSFRAFAHAQTLIFDTYNLTLHRDLNGINYFGYAPYYFPDEPLPLHGFAAFNITPVVRFTNNGFSILTDEDREKIPVYHDIAWI